MPKTKSVKVACSYCNREFFERGLRVHLASCTKRIEQEVSEEQIANGEILVEEVVVVGQQLWLRTGDNKIIRFGLTRNAVIHTNTAKPHYFC